MDNPEKLATQGTQDEEKQNKNTTQYVLDTTIDAKNTNNVNKAFLQTCNDINIHSCCQRYVFLYTQLKIYLQHLNTLQIININI